MVPTSYEELADDEELEMVPVINQNNSDCFNIVSDSESKSNDDENLLDEDIVDEVEMTPRQLSTQKWYKP